MKRKLLFISMALLLALALLCSCAQGGGSAPAASGEASAAPAATASAEAGTRTVADRNGKTYTIGAAARIVSTGPTNTELLIGLGLADRLVGVDVYSKDIAGVPAGAEAFDFYTFDAEKLLALKPDIVVATAFDTALESLEGVTVVTIPAATSFADIEADLAFLGEVFGESEKAAALSAQMDGEIAAVKELAAKVTAKKKVYIEMEPAPAMYTVGAGTYLNEMIELIGAENIFATTDGYILANAEAIVAANPDVILTTCSYIETARTDILTREGFSGIKAVADGAVFVLDSDLMSRASQNATKALLALGQAVYPEMFGE